MTSKWYGVHQPSKMDNFAVDSYNLTKKGSWCTAPNSIYTNPKANFGYFNNFLTISMIFLNLYFYKITNKKKIS